MFQMLYAQGNNPQYPLDKRPQLRIEHLNLVCIVHSFASTCAKWELDMEKFSGSSGFHYEQILL
jgi:hypothetical protein